MLIVKKPITLKQLSRIAQKKFGNLVKAVVDVKKEIMAVDAELHADEEALLLEKGSKQEDLWGINLYPELKGKDWIEFDSMINIRPSAGNMSRNVEDTKIRGKITKVVGDLVKR